MVTLAYRHGLRASELVGLRRDAFDLKLARLHVSRLKGSEASTQPLQADTIKALRKLFAETPDNVFALVNERGEPFARAGFQRIAQRAGEKAGLAFGVHSHILRHACGYKLANDGEDTRAIQGYLGHKNINHTCRYTKLAADRFKAFRW